MVGIIQEAKNRTPVIRQLDAQSTVIIPNPPPKPPKPKTVETPKGILRKMEPERLVVDSISLEDLFGM